MIKTENQEFDKMINSFSDEKHLFFVRVSLLTACSCAAVDAKEANKDVGSLKRAADALANLVAFETLTKHGLLEAPDYGKDIGCVFEPMVVLTEGKGIFVVSVEVHCSQDKIKELKKKHITYDDLKRTYLEINDKLLKSSPIYYDYR